MAVVSMMKMSGDADELAAKLREHVAPVGRELAPGHGGLGTIVVPHRRRRADHQPLGERRRPPRAGRRSRGSSRRSQAGGFPPPAFEGYEVLTWTILPAAVRDG